MPQNQIIGTENDDYLLDSFSNDEILASNGDDEITTSSGNDVVYGDEGIDRLIVDYSTHDENIVFSLQDYDSFNYDGSLHIDFWKTIATI